MPAYKYETSDGKTLWYCSFHYRDWTGTSKRKKKKGFQTRKAALEWERKFLDQTAENPEILFSSLIENYLADCDTRLKPTTAKNKRYVVEDKLLPYFGDLPIMDITPLKIRKWQKQLMDYTDASGKGYAPTYLKTIHAQMSAVMNYAVRYYGLKSNPCTVAGGIGKSKADEMKVWSREEFEQFLQHEKKMSYRIAFALLFYTGIREGEMLALTPADIKDFTIVINKNYQVVEGHEFFLIPKTDKSNRVVPVHKKLYNDILEYIRGAMIDTEDRIFYFTKSGLTSEFKRCTARAGLSPIRVHDLRHSHASMLIQMGIPITEISARLGHESPKITLGIYSHMYPDNARNVSEKIDELFVDGEDGL